MFKITVRAVRGEHKGTQHETTYNDFNLWVNQEEKMMAVYGCNPLRIGLKGFKKYGEEIEIGAYPSDPNLAIFITIYANRELYGMYYLIKETEE